LAATTFGEPLAQLQVDVFRLGVEGMRVLAAWPVLSQLRFLDLHNASSHEVRGLEALAESPHPGPLLRIDLTNGHVSRDARPLLRRRFQGRFRAMGRTMPQTVSLGSWAQFLGEDD
jgi:hypothetical protein